MRKVFKYIFKYQFILTVVFLLGLNSLNAKTIYTPLLQEPDSLGQETRYPSIDGESNNPFLKKEQQSSIQLQESESFQYSTSYNPQTGEVSFYRKIGNINVRLPYTMTLEEYLDEDVRNSMLAYWEGRAQTVDSDDKFSIFNPSLNLGSELDNLLGGNLINIKPQGRAELKIGVNQTTIDNPTLQEDLRKTTTFDFDEKIQMNIQGTIGDKLKLGINYNTEATFEFENEMKLEYEGKEDDIIQSIEAGNVSLSLPGTLITGSQSLFGIKTDLQFGKLSVSALAAQQKGETTVLDVQGGAQQQEFEVAINEYDKNRHFFLSNFFRDLYNTAQSSYPINSRITIQKIEVWVTNTAGDYDDARDIVGFMDIGENNNNIYNTNLWSQSSADRNPSNATNNLYNDMNTTYSAIRDINQVTSTLKSLSGNGFTSGQDYEKIENARLLSSSEYTLNSQLGFISLNSALNSDEVLAVAFEYDYNGETYTVGEFTNSGNEASTSLFLKLLKSTNLTPKVKPTWDLMMKNIYSLGAYQVNSEDFEMDIAYVDDSTGAYINYLPEDDIFANQDDSIPLLLRIMNLDRLNDILDPIPDGVFDYIEDQTIYPENGRIIFPVLEPFGSHLEDVINSSTAISSSRKNELIDKYVYQALYDSTQTNATQISEKNKFYLRGTYKSSISSEISLNAQNIPQGSVVVTAGGIKLTENVDYTVDYTFGTVKIINSGLLESGTPIKISLESQSLFNLQTKTLLGTHLNYQFNDNFNIGATVEYLREQPLTQKVNIGDEPIANTIYGFNTSYYTESQWLTNVLNKIPGLQATEPSSISFDGEFAQIIPGSPDIIDGEAYLDDFEGTETSIDLRNWTAWSLASAPQGQDELIPNASNIDDLTYGYDRAKLAWYNVDPLFFRNNQYTPTHIANDLDEQSNHYVRIIYEEEIWPEMESEYGQPTNISVLNLAYYPKERGPYNFDTDLNEDGELNTPEKRWGGIQREIETNDFEAANVEFIEFWMMDPFIYNEDPNKAGELYFNLGNVSEDVLNDSRKFFEQGLPGPDETSELDQTVWGNIPTKTSLVSAFSNDSEARLMQDIGFDGLNDEEEGEFYQDYINSINNLFSMGSLTDEAYQNIINDPSADDYHYFRGPDFDAAKTSILDRYKNFNGPEGNSMPSEYTKLGYSTAATSIPDQEDINGDNTLSETESYYQYKVSLDPQNMVVGENYITDVRTASVSLKNNTTDEVKWYQFRIPISSPDKTVGNISDFTSIRFMRMFLNGFQDTTILRFATLDLVRSEWRKYENDLVEDDETLIENENTTFTTGVVNIEENAERTPINYVLPPGVDRVIDPANPQIRQLNEQSITLNVTDLPKNDRRAIYKTVSLDLRQYGRLTMDVHAEEVDEGSIGDNNVRAFIRLGSDSKDNYYEYEVPLEMTAHGGAMSDEEVWPENNQIDFSLSLFQSIKLERNDNSASTSEVYIVQDGNNWVKIKGNPNLGNIKTILLGVRNTLSSKVVSFETWFNELRVSEFEEKGGWAANGQMNIKLSDLGNISIAGNKSTIGFGSVDQSVSERSQEDYQQVDFATSMELGKFLGSKSRVSAPFYYSQSKEVTTPEYYPLNPDIKLDLVLENAKTKAERDSILNLSQDVVERKSVNFTNVRVKSKSDKKKNNFYDISNLSATYAYNETKSHDVNTEKEIEKEFKAVVAYNFNNRPKNYEPFKNSKLLKGSAFKILKDFNFYLMPTQVSYRTEMLRDYNETQLRNVNNPDYKIPITISKNFNWNRYFDLNYNFTKALKFDFSSTTNARIDEPDGVVDKDEYKTEYELWKDSVLTNILNGGRITNYQHNFNVNYNLPINKLPYLNWISSNIRYTGKYYWEIAPSSTSDDIEWGNTITNGNNIQGTVNLTMITLYNQSKYLKGLSRKYSNNKGNNNQNQKRTVRYNKEDITLKKGESYIINHKLKTNDVRVRMFDQNGRTARGKIVQINDSKTEFVPEADYEKARVMVTGTVIDKTTVFNTVVDYSAMVLTGVKNVSLSYTETNSTSLPGYLPDSKFLGTSTYNGFNAPGYNFIMGFQDRDFAQKAANKGWITVDTINYPYIMTELKDLTLKASIQPVNGLRIDLNSNRRYANNMQEYYYKNGSSFSAYNTRESGSFSMTYNIIGTAFKKVSKKGSYESETYNRFLQNRSEIAKRLVNKRLQSNPNYINNILASDPENQNPNGYGLYTQDVLIPSFLAAYSGTNTDNIFTTLFPSAFLMQPNWRITYNGLSKINFFKKYIRSFDVSHTYKSTYTISSYSTNSDYSEDMSGISWVRDTQENFISHYQVNSVTLSESFQPLIGFNITWNNSLITKVEVAKARGLSLSLTSNQLVETYDDKFTVGLGYRFDKMDMILGSGRGAKKMSSDLNLSLDLSIKDNMALIRQIEDNTSQLTSGSKITAINFTADYVLSDKFSMQVYYDRTVSNPYISTSYPTTTSNFGVSFSFSLSQ